MTLENLLAIGRLKRHETDAAEIQRLIGAARRNLQDSHVRMVSGETRFDTAYKCIFQAALAALMANGFRPDTHRPGHHVTVIQSLPKTIGLKTRNMVVLDALRRRRNLADYTGEEIDGGLVESCIDEAETLLSAVSNWLERTHPEYCG
jgi:uncharacterized protein (UPF0332 family)